ncbi:MAG TPA: hypothetical protein VGM64_12140 [Lacunisphaera sp.]|jgi:hypothetical protein
MKNENKGFILGVVLCTAILMLLIVASLFELIRTQRRLSVGKENLLQANNAAETSIDYAYSCIINDINVNGVTRASSIPTTSYREFVFDPAAASYLTGVSTMSPTYHGKISNIAYSNNSVRILPISDKTHMFVNATDPLALTDPTLANQNVYERLVPVIARVTATQGGQTYTAYVKKSVACEEIDLFQYAIFFQGQLHMHRGFQPLGDVHTNGMLFLNAQDGDTATYNGAVSATGYIYRGSTFDSSGTGSDGYGYVPVNASGDADFTASSPTVSPHATGTSNQLQILVQGTSGAVEYGMGNSNSSTEGEDYHTDPAHWQTWATNKFKGNLRDKAHNVPAITLVGAAGYAQDVASTTSKNEFNNGPYKLLEPTLPASFADTLRMSSNINNLEANASLVLIIEYNCSDNGTIKLHRIADGGVVTIGDGSAGHGGLIESMSVADPTSSPDTVGSRPTLSKYSDPWRMFVVKGYRVKAAWNPANPTMKDIHDYLVSIPLPTNVFGAANKTVSAVSTTLKMEDFDTYLSVNSQNDVSTLGTGTGTPIYTFYNGLSGSNKTKFNDNSSSGTLKVQVTKGLFDSRLGRGVAPLTIDIDRLKDILEAPLVNFDSTNDPIPASPATGYNKAFRIAFDPTADTGTYLKWNGLIYIEFPTSLALDSSLTVNSQNGIDTLRFAYSSAPELRHPDRSDATDARANREDNIIPIDPSLRRYPPAASANLNGTILDPQYAIPAVQLINARSLPHPNTATSSEGFTIATNVPVYCVGNYNADGDITTPANLTSSAPFSYPTAETNPVEIPAAIFSDMFTVLSNGWGVQYGATGLDGAVLSNRQNSFYGTNKGTTNGDGTGTGSVGSPPGRPAKSLLATDHTDPNYYSFVRKSSTMAFVNSNPSSGVGAKPYVEISACIATGEYPIFEFFTHALESYQPMYSAMSTTHANPIIFKGSMVGMFHSEIQHIKQAYGRSISSNVQTGGDPSGNIWEQHGSYAIAGSRFSQSLVDGNFPPGTPKEFLTTQRGFSLLHWNNSADAALLTQAGFTAP